MSNLFLERLQNRETLHEFGPLQRSPETTGENLQKLAAEIELELALIYAALDVIAFDNQRRVLEAFRRNRVSEYHFRPSTGYGYGDDGRDTLDRVFAEVFGAEDALVRTQIVSGTHALGICLLALLRPGDGLVALGRPYDTIQTVIGLTGDSAGSLISSGVSYREVDFAPDGGVDQEALLRVIDDQTRLILLQRSRGYHWRRSLDIETMRRTIESVRRSHPHVIILVDNCYGEFVEREEPTHAGADLACGSLIKNPGGGLAPTGGYVVGRADLVERAAERLTAPGLGREVGSVPGGLRLYYQGLFLAPHFVVQALKGAVFAARMLEGLGFVTSPRYNEHRTDIVQAVQLGDPEAVLAFCRAIQAASPVDAHVTPEAAPLPGYDDGVVMAAGTFVQGASLELTADAPMRNPYTVYLQGGLTKEHAKLGIIKACEALMNRKKQSG